ncbi:anaerobic sulfite reductase subunit AsrA [Clostridium saccharobutylicum]|uniref:Anaerobic sulfite reductase subunit A n=1 Tax=Clostridium saccharobutylicum TaxID=169679 RepID=A0A1S8MYC3_CLOSA|nr:anaerobic sulfite reductase subunit AsrA [Clostridium saccharobutylicum]OOM09170.1 anaerobic sulfite reductase subunit A [Clostridium saccharobutylicum]
MGYKIITQDVNSLLSKLSKEYLIYAPKVFEGDGCFSDTDTVRYGEISTIEEIVFDRKSDYSFKEILLPITQTLFYFTEDEVKVADAPKKGAIVFLRSCDLHALKRMDQIYLNNGPEDFYYKRLRENTKFILMGCSETFDNCFCVNMKTNTTDEYDAYIKVSEDFTLIDCKWDKLDDLIKEEKFKEERVSPDFVTENKVNVNIPDNLSTKIVNSKIWDEYTSRCIGCGRCNFVCPTCTCFTMQDIFYKDNGKAGERRRIWASCQINGYTDMAGGITFRKPQGQRMRFKVMHKVYDYKKRFGYHMCVGCGRCDDVCPEYISFSNCINKLENAMKEVE